MVNGRIQFCGFKTFTDGCSVNKETIFRISNCDSAQNCIEN